MIKQSLINSEQVIRLTSLTRSAKDHHLKPHMNLKKIFMTHESIELLDILKGDLKEYDAEDYDSGNTYEVDDLAVECGVIYKMLDVGGNGVVEIYCDENWEEVDRFESDCLNALYPVLQDWLAWQIAADAVPFIHVEIGGDGAMVQGSNGRRGEAASQKMYNMGVSSYRKAAQTSLNLFRNQMQYQINKGECDILSAEDSSCSNVKEEKISNTGYGIQW